MTKKGGFDYKCQGLNCSYEILLIQKQSYLLSWEDVIHQGHLLVVFTRQLVIDVWIQNLLLTYNDEQDINE